MLLDVVYNHFGPDGNVTGAFGPYLTDRYRTPWGAAVNLDGPGSDEVRRFFIDNALMWLRDYHVDGLRIDAVHAIVDTSATHLLEQLADEVRALSRRHRARPRPDRRERPQRSAPGPADRRSAATASTRLERRPPSRAPRRR